MSEPTNSELGRRLDQIYGAVRDLIGRAEYSEFQRSVEHRIADLMRDTEDVRKQHTEDVRELHKRIGDEAEKAAARGQWKTTLLVGLIPALVAVAAILVEIWLKGGHG